MNNLKSIIMGVIRNECMCRLCFKELQLDVDSIHNINDEVILDAERNISITILSMLKELMSENIDVGKPLLDIVCNNCTQSAVSAYKFLLLCKDSTEYLRNLMQSFIKCFDKDEGVSFSAKTVYYSINKKGKCESICDFKRNISTTEKAIQRFVNLQKLKKHKKVTRSHRNSYEIKRKRLSVTESGVLPEDSSVPVEKKFTCMCCLKHFRRYYNLTDHYKRVHAPKKFVCPKCPRRFGTAYLLKLHLSESHVVVICAKCGNSYNNVHSLRLHEKSAHKAKILCDTCGKYYKNKQGYRHHITVGLCTQDIFKYNTDKYTCDICKRTYATKGNLRMHISFEHGNAKAFICDWCGKRFPQYSRLQAHIVKHTKERNFICNVCGGKFVTKESLLYHTRLHTGEKPYACSCCDERFLSASRRMAHIRRKHMAPTFLCDSCDGRFRTRYALRKHIKRHLNPNSRLFNKTTHSNCLDYNEF